MKHLAVIASLAAGSIMSKEGYHALQEFLKDDEDKDREVNADQLKLM